MSLPSDLTIIVVGSSGRIGSDMTRMLRERDMRVLRCDLDKDASDLPPPKQWRASTIPAGSAIWYLACGPNGCLMGEEEATADYIAARDAIDWSANAGVFVYADSPWRLRRPTTPYGGGKQALISYAHRPHSSARPLFISDPIGRYHRDAATIDSIPKGQKFAVVSPQELFARWMRLTEYALGDWA